MITLHIKEKGHLVEIPGMPSFRTPATVDISKGDIRSIVGYLKVCDISDYEIIASNNDTREVYRAKDFNTTTKVVEKKKKIKNPTKKLENRIDRIEKMLKNISDKPSGDSGKKLEQTTKQMEQFQNTILDAIKNINTGGSSNVNKTERRERDSLEDEPAPFIPDIDTNGMKLKSQGDHKTIKKEGNADEDADALSKLLK
jgi:hypothetical protein